jgi:endonuclease III
VVVNINGRKATWVQQLTDFLAAHKIETEDQLRAWLAAPEHEQALFALKGVGLKTVNYLKLLAGIPKSVAVDTHVRAFLAAAGIRPVDDRETGHIVAEAARLLGTSAAQLDASIWVYRIRSASVEYQVSGR